MVFITAKLLPYLQVTTGVADNKTKPLGSIDSRMVAMMVMI